MWWQGSLSLSFFLTSMWYILYRFSWRHQLKEFSQAFKVVALDLKGYGLSDAPLAWECYQRDIILEDIQDVIKALGSSEKDGEFRKKVFFSWLENLICYNSGYNSSLFLGVGGVGVGVGRAPLLLLSWLSFQKYFKTTSGSFLWLSELMAKILVQAFFPPGSFSSFVR